MGVIIPLITFPYSSRVLGPEALGKVDYAQANMTYFTLLQAFGIGGYAIREGARIRDDRKKMDEFASDMLSINLMTSALAYVLFFAALAIPKLAGYRTLMLLFSTTIVVEKSSINVRYPASLGIASAAKKSTYASAEVIRLMDSISLANSSIFFRSSRIRAPSPDCIAANAKRLQQREVCHVRLRIIDLTECFRSQDSGRIWECNERYDHTHHRPHHIRYEINT